MNMKTFYITYQDGVPAYGVCVMATGSTQEVPISVNVAEQFYHFAKQWRKQLRYDLAMKNEEFADAILELA